MTDSAQRIVDLPSPERLLSGFIARAHLIQSARYMKVQLVEDPARYIDVFIDENEVSKSMEDILRGSQMLYPDMSDADRLAAVLSVGLFECLDSLPPNAQRIFYRRGAFRAE
jgi:hypothetical protein